LAAELAALSATFHLLPPDHSALEQFAALCDNGVVPHLFVVTEALGNISSNQDWQARREANVVLPFKLVQRWLAHLPAGFQGASVVGITALGGDYGLNGQSSVPESGALCGLLKSLHVETLVKGERQILVKVIDFADSETPHAVARHVLVELTGDAGYVEFAYHQGIRQRIAALREDLQGDGEHQIKRGGQWLVTGGARGFTGQMAMRLARDYGLRLQLLGSSPMPDRNSAWHKMNAEELQDFKRELTKQALANGRTPASLWQPIQTDLEIQANLKAYYEADVEAHYHSCDLGNHEQLASVLENIRKQHGPIDGILHGAGVRHTVRLEQVSPKQVENSLRAKLDGTVSLMTLTDGDPIKHFVSFGSLGGRFGTNGGSDYAMVNEALAKLTAWYRSTKSDCAAVTMHWHAIAGVGMMTRPQSFGPAAMAKLNLMSVDEAYLHLRQELLAGCPESEVLTTDGEYHRRFYPADAVVLELPVQQIANAHPLLESIADGYWPLALDPVNDVFLKEHRFKGKPLLPMVAGIEALAEAEVGELTAHDPFELHNIRVHQPFKFFADKPIAAKVVSENVDGIQHLKLVADFRNRRDQLVQANRLYLRAEFGGKSHAEPRRLTGTLPRKFNDAWYPDDERSIYHGPSFRCVKQASTSESVGWTKIVAPDPNGLNGPHRNGNWVVPSVVLDGALFSCGIYFYIHRPGTVAIPLGIERLRVFGVPRAGEVCLCHYQLKDATEQQASFDFVIYDAQGRELVSSVNYQAALFREVMV
jgi:NAD(P)-dependent dehydrogenase (short-subunit alcohol dehydrogenase family)